MDPLLTATARSGFREHPPQIKELACLKGQGENTNVVEGESLHVTTETVVLDRSLSRKRVAGGAITYPQSGGPTIIPQVEVDRCQSRIRRPWKQVHI